MTARCAIAGAALGVGWATAARAWMRLVSTNPEFSWSGTGFIIGGGLVIGFALGVVEGRRRAGGSAWWRLLGVVVLPYFAGPGTVLLPALLLGGFALSGRGPRWVRVVVGSLPVAATVAIFLGELVETPRAPWAAVVGFVALNLALAYAGSVMFRRTHRRQVTRQVGQDAQQTQFA